MYRLFTPILVIQVFCLYHAFSNKKDVKWYLLIILFPLMGSVIYLVYHFYNRSNVDNVTEAVSQATVSNYKIKKLKRELNQTDTVKNRVLLADEYFHLQAYPEAIRLYESCLEGLYSDDPGVLRKLVESTFLIEDYTKTIAYGDIIKDDITFRKSDERIAYAWSFHFDNQSERSEEVFKGMDTRYVNYMHRLEYSKFLHLSNRNEECIDKLNELIEEIDSMHTREKRAKSGIYKDISQLLNDVSK